MSIIKNGFERSDLGVPSVSPSLNLDFANSQSLDKRIRFSRGSIGTFVDKNGLISIASTNQPRFDYDPISGECRGLLVEEQRTNLVGNSTTVGFGGALNNLSSLTDGSLAPDGSSAVAYIPNSNVIVHSVGSFTTINLDTIGIATGATYDVTYSYWAKDYNQSDYGAYFVIAAYLAGTPNTNLTYFTRIAKPKTGTFTSGNLGTGWTRNYEKVVRYPNGWYRFIQAARYTRQSNQNSLFFNIQVFNNSNTQTYGGDGTSGIYIWGPQVESATSPAQAPFETSYIPTSGSAVTRSPDLARLTEPYFSEFFNKYEGSVFVNYNINVPVDSGSVYNLQRTPTLFYVGDVGDGTYQGYGVTQDVATYGNHRLTGQTAAQRAFINSGNVYTSGSPITNGKVCFSYDSDKLRLTCDKLKSVISANRRGTNNYIQSITTEVFNEITIGWGNNGGFATRYINGTIKNLKFYPKSLNDEQMLYLVN